MNGLRPVLAICAMLCLRALAVDTPEVEPNDGKAGATTVNNGGLGLVSGDTISGSTTGASGGGGGSSDYFIITTAPTTNGFYRHELALTSPTPGHTVTIRGLSQTNGVINAGTDVTLQTGVLGYPGQSPDARTVVWFGFGKGERVYVRVTGTKSTTASYSLTLTTSPVPPLPLPGAIIEGSLTVERDPVNMTDTDFWMYNGFFAAIPGYGNDNPNRLTRPYTPGTYYIGLSNNNTANNLASPGDDLNRSGNVTDFADVLVNSSATTGLDLGMTINGGAGLVNAASTKTRPFDVTLYCFTVFPNTISTPPVGQAEVEPGETDNCARGVVCLRVTATPGANPPSSGVSVQVNLSSIGLGVQTMQDNGLGCDSLGGDLVFSLQVPVPPGTLPGTYTFPFIVRDAQERISQGFMQLRINGCGAAPPNDPCEQAQNIVPGEAFTGTTINAMLDPNLRNCRGGDITAPGVWFRTIGNGRRMTVQLCASANPFDAQVSVYCGSGGCDKLDCIGGDDNSCGPLPRFSWCTEEGGVYYILVHGTGLAVGEFLLELDDNGVPCSSALPCTPRGACCLIDGCRTVTPEECALAGGDYLGDFSSCIAADTRTRFISTNAFPLTVPDNSPTGITATIFVPFGSGLVSNLVPVIGLRHGTVSDLTVTLTHNTTTVTLMSAEDGTADVDGAYEFADYASRFLGQGRGTPIQPGIYRPRNPLVAFDGQLFQGLWTLRVTDTSPSTVGQVLGFALRTATITENCPSECPLCAADYNGDGGIDGADVQAFYGAWESGDACSDVNGDGGIDGSDVQFFFEAWENGDCS
ncbi:MAG: hypothetical protein JNK25_12545 [Phycisphaerae bacterium]|nr:hypothetical protein [Phycisphaerae bacterium]